MRRLSPQAAFLALLLVTAPFACSDTDEAPANSTADGGSTDGPSAADTDTDTGTGTDTDTVAATDTATASGPPYAIGVTTLTTIGANGRQLPTEVWYPIATGSKGTAVTYALGLIPSPYGALRDVPALPGPFPLLAFSHGNGGVRDQSVFLTEAVARQGYVVVSPDHIGNTATTMDNNLGGVMSLWRPQDISAAIDRVLKPQTEDGPWLTGLVDPDKIAISGHSFGGYTSLALAGMPVGLPAGVSLNCAAPEQVAACKEIEKLGPPPWDLGDPRIDVAIPLAHALYAAGVLAKPTGKVPAIPIILMAASGDTLTKPNLEAEPLYADLADQAALVMIQGGSHYSFANICELMPFMPADLKAAVGNICNGSTKPTMDEVQAVVVEHTLAALDIWLRGNDNARKAFDPAKTTGPVYTIKSKGIYPK